MIPTETLVFEENKRKRHKNNQGDDFLQHLQLDERKWATVALKANFIGRYLKAIFQQGNAPTDEDNCKQWQGFKPFEFLKF